MKCVPRTTARRYVCDLCDSDDFGDTFKGKVFDLEGRLFDQFSLKKE